MTTTFQRTHQAFCDSQPVSHAGCARKAVAICEIRSDIPGIPAQYARDAFIASLLNSCAFVLAGRTRTAYGSDVTPEMNAGLKTMGAPAGSQLERASYIFDGTVCGANQCQCRADGGVSIDSTPGGIGGLDTVGIEIRVIDASNGLVLDSITSQQMVEMPSPGSVPGGGGLAGATASTVGPTLPTAGNTNHEASRKQSMDRALRACIEAVVIELIKCYASQ